jgi:hypothetical protein
VTALCLALAVLGAIGFACWFCYQAGRCDERVSHLHDITRANIAAEAVRDRLRHDAAYAGRLRARFTR